MFVSGPIQDPYGPANSIWIITSEIEFHRKRPRICANQRSRAVHCDIQIYQTSITEKVRIGIHFWKVKKQSRFRRKLFRLIRTPWKSSFNPLTPIASATLNGPNNPWGVLLPFSEVVTLQDTYAFSRSKENSRPCS